MLLSLLSQVIVLFRLPRVYGGFGLLKLHNIEYDNLHRIRSRRALHTGPTPIVDIFIVKR